MSKIKTQSVHGSKSKVTKPHYHYFINTCKSLFWVIINSRLIQKKIFNHRDHYTDRVTEVKITDSMLEQ